MITLLILLLVILALAITMIRAGLVGAPWVPTFKKASLAGIELAGIKEGDIVYDLGCGDGRWLKKAAALTKAKKLIGLEISLLPYWLAKINFLLSPERRRLSVKWQNLYLADLSQADVVYCFGLPEVLAKLESKLRRELKPGARFVSYVFSLPDKKPDRVFKISEHSAKIYLYSFWNLLTGLLLDSWVVVVIVEVEDS